MPRTVDRRRRDPVPLVRKAAVAGRAVAWYGIVLFRLRRRRLPEVVAELGRTSRPVTPRAGPVRLGRIVHRTLRLGPVQARCLHAAMVHFRLLREQGEAAELVIGLPDEARDKDAHAWVEIDGRDVGPPPGRGRHAELARYR